MTWRGFGSDNHSGVHPEVLAAIVAANDGHAHPYGDDPWTAAAHATLKRHLGEECDIAFVWNGTGANCVSFAVACKPWESVICPMTAHINCDECAAPQRVAGVKLVPVETPDGKLTPAMVEPHLGVLGFEHAAQPRVVSVSNVTELGTVYTPAELRALAEFAHARGLLLHVDGARIANACVALGCTMRELVTDVGVDLFSLGGTKNGMLAGEAVVLLGDGRSERPEVRAQAAHAALEQTALRRCAVLGDVQRRAVAGQRASRERHGGAPCRGRTRATGCGSRKNRKPTRSSPSCPLRRSRLWSSDSTSTCGTRPSSVVRWVTSWDTTPGDVDALVAEVLAGAHLVNGAPVRHVNTACIADYGVGLCGHTEHGPRRSRRRKARLLHPRRTTRARCPNLVAVSSPLPFQAVYPRAAIRRSPAIHPGREVAVDIRPDQSREVGTSVHVSSCDRLPGAVVVLGDRERVSGARGLRALRVRVIAFP